LTHLGNQLLNAWATKTDNTEVSNIIRKIIGVAARACVNIGKVDPSKFTANGLSDYRWKTVESGVRAIYAKLSRATFDPYNFVIADTLTICAWFVREFGVPLRTL